MKKEKIFQYVPVENIEAYFDIYNTMKKLQDTVGESKQYPREEFDKIKSILNKLAKRGKFPKAGIIPVFARIATVTADFYDPASRLELRLKHLKGEEIKKTGAIPDWALRFLIYALVHDIRIAIYKKTGKLENHFSAVRDWLESHQIHQTRDDIRQSFNNTQKDYLNLMNVLEIYAGICQQTNVPFLSDNVRDLTGGFIDEIKDTLSEGTADTWRDTVTINGKKKPRIENLS